MCVSMYIYIGILTSLEINTVGKIMKQDLVVIFKTFMNTFENTVHHNCINVAQNLPQVQAC